MQALSRREEDAIYKDVKKQAVKNCDDYLRDFAACSQGRTITVTWKCRGQWKAMQECMRLEMSQDKLDRAKLDFLDQRRQTSGQPQT